MKRLFYFFGIIISFAFIFIACQKESDKSESTTDAFLKAKMDKIWICHLDEYGNWITININKNALEAHLAHGDKVVFPQVGTFHWVYGGSYNHYMYITEVTDEAFSGYGVWWNNSCYTWDIIDGTINEDGSYEFGVDYTNCNPDFYIDCEGYFDCENGAYGTSTGSANLNWTLSYYGPLPE